MTKSGVHPEHEETPWTIDLANHADRTETSAYSRSRTLMGKLVAQTQPWWFGPPAYQDHHGGGIWLKDDAGWVLVLALSGIEWSAQFCADPAKVDTMRAMAARVVAGFPQTVPAYVEMGYHDAAALLTTPITDVATVQAWTDGIFNASVALPAPMHTGVRPQGAGYHHYPKPIIDILMFKHDDFELFVDDGAGKQVAVTPVAGRGSGDGRVNVVWTEPGSTLAKAHSDAEANNTPLVLPEDHPAARAAFINQ